MNNSGRAKVHWARQTMPRRKSASRGEADMLLCLKIDLTGDWTEIYYGDFGLVKKAARYSARDNKHMVPLAALLRIAKAGYVLPDITLVADIQAATDEPI